MPGRRPAVSFAFAAVLCGLLIVSGVNCVGGGGGDGTIEVSGRGVTIELSGPKTVTINSGQSVSVPAGTYKMRRVRVVASEQAGGMTIPWTLVGKGSAGKLRRIKVRSGKTTTIEVGAPFTLRAKTKVQRGGSATTVEIEMQVVGASGELYSHEIHRGGSLVPPPRFRIVDRRKRVLTQGSLSYG